jgi:hypothetical protein
MKVLDEAVIAMATKAALHRWRLNEGSGRSELVSLSISPILGKWSVP